MNELKDTKTKIQQRFPDIEFKEEIFNGFLFLTFKTKFQNDYNFYIEISKEFKYVNVGALLENQPWNQYFWHTGIDYTINQNENKEIFLAFIFEMLEILKNYRTRIIQEKKLLLQIFTLEYFIENEWKKLDQRNGFRFSKFRFPKIDGNRKMYE